VPHRSYWHCIQHPIPNDGFRATCGGKRRRHHIELRIRVAGLSATVQVAAAMMWT
jgi:hypothetical protein